MQRRRPSTAADSARAEQRGATTSRGPAGASSAAGTVRTATTAGSSHADAAQRLAHARAPRGGRPRAPRRTPRPRRAHDHAGTGRPRSPPARARRPAPARGRAASTRPGVYRWEASCRSTPRLTAHAMSAAASVPSMPATAVATAGDGGEGQRVSGERGRPRRRARAAANPSRSAACSRPSGSADANGETKAAMASAMPSSAGDERARRGHAAVRRHAADEVRAPAQYGGQHRAGERGFEQADRHVRDEHQLHDGPQGIEARQSQPQRGEDGGRQRGGERAEHAAGHAAARRRGPSRGDAAPRRSRPATPARPMSVMFAPSAVMPPSWKSSACTVSTTAMTMTRAPGPEQDGGERRADQVAADAGRDGDVDHLRREHERRRGAQHAGRHRVGIGLLRRAAPPATPAPATAHVRRHARREKAVRDVHGAA